MDDLALAIWFPNFRACFRAVLWGSHARLKVAMALGPLGQILSFTGVMTEQQLV